MLHNYIKINSDKIVKATPSGYTIKELKKPTGYWTKYETDEFTNLGISDFTIVNTSPRSITNPFDVFIQKKSVEAKYVTESVTESVENALNIDSHWDKAFPETIRLKYPGIITNNNFSERRKLDKEEVYTFKIWENRNSSSVDVARVIPNDVLPNTLSTSDYFYDLQHFIKTDSGTSYEEWLKRPSFSLKNLLTKGIQIRDDIIMYQLYKINDVSVQSLSTDFDEYIPWCFDQNGVKISQHKIATITSFNKKEIYILMELRKDDIKINNSLVEIPVITNIVFWRSGINDNRITMDIRNKDQMLLMKDTNISNISDYFRESKIKTNTLVNFQKDRLENEILDTTPVDNDDGDNNRYQFEYNSDPYFTIQKAKDSSRKLIFGRLNTTSLNISMGGNIFTDHNKDRVHIFVDGSLLTNDEFYIMNGRIISTIPSSNTFIEIFINQYTSVSYSFTLNTSKISLLQDELNYILYNNGFLWKTKQDKEYLLFDKGTFGCKLVNNDTVPNGKYLIIHSLFYDLLYDPEDVAATNPTGTIVTVDLETDRSDARDYNINYDPLLFKTSQFNGNGSLKDKDLWIFDNTKNLINIGSNEPYLIKNTDGKIKVMSEPDKNLTLVADTSIVNLKNALTNGNIHNEIISPSEKNYLIEHYSQMSTVNRNILNMFLHSGVNSWSNLSANTTIKITKDYLVVRYTSTDEFPLLTIHKTNIYNYNIPQNTVQVKVKPTRVVYNYYILHRTDNDFTNLYEYSFNKQISYIMI